MENRDTDYFPAWEIIKIQSVQQMLKELLQAGNIREGKDVQKQTQNN